VLKRCLTDTLKLARICFVKNMWLEYPLKETGNIIQNFNSYQDILLAISVKVLEKYSYKE
jgi:hypothetical protein